MADVPVTLNGVLYDLWARTTQRVVFIGDASLTGLSVGGGPMPGGPPNAIWPPGSGIDMPAHPIAPGGPPGWAQHPIWGPPGFNPGGPGMPPGTWGGQPPNYVDTAPPQPQPPLPPSVTPPNPGDPTQPYPPPAGSAGWPVQPITPPPYVVINYPGVGPVIVAPPAEAAK